MLMARVSAGGGSKEVSSFFEKKEAKNFYHLAPVALS
jgi:hypothetical protein